MKTLTKLAFLLAFIMPYGVATADTHDDATMDVIEHSNSDHYENEIELPHSEDHDDDHKDGKDNDHDGKGDDDKEDGHDESHEEKEDSKDDSKDDSEDDSKEDGDDHDSKS